MNSLGFGGVVLGAAGAGALTGGGVTGADGGLTMLGALGALGMLGALGAAGAGGAGAEATVVAGRFGHPTRKRVRASSGTTSSTLPRRCAMMSDPPL
jgi:hypothetical protein